MQVEILKDGSIKVETDKVSSGNHMSAEAFIRFISEQAGGKTTRVAKGHRHTHEHEHVEQEG